MQNFQAGGARCNSAKRELEIIAKPLRVLREALLSGRSFLAPCAQKLATTLCALATYRLLLSIRLGRCLPIFAMRHLLRWSSRRFAFAAFNLLIRAGVEAGPW